MKLRHALLALAVGTAATGFARETAPLTTVGSVDAARYAGRWYEIANYPNRFQRVCTGNTTAEYAPREDGTLRVINRCSTVRGLGS